MSQIILLKIEHKLLMNNQVSNTGTTYPVV
jgi:hypothetical protein